ncbi:hypothetical protein [Romboutsia ilealis]|uniref:hypothetical protein n=1 Tax=Romboutsia ilealis TaxID=1115758 RepID=UPI00272BE36F|nr:hypothetical protein [Romboutsia ilealis]
MNFKCLLNDQGILFECKQLQENEDKYRITYINIKENNSISHVGSLEECNEKIKSIGIIVYNY